MPIYDSIKIDTTRNLNCVDVLWYSNLITQPLQTIIKLHKTVFDVNENNSGHNPELTSNTNKPNEAPCNDFIACNDDSIEIQCPSLTLQLLCLYRVSDSVCYFKDNYFSMG